MNHATTALTSVAAKVCPVAPPGAEKYADQLLGYVLWGIGILFILGVVVWIAPPLAFVLMLTVLIMSFVRRARANRAG